MFTADTLTGSKPEQYRQLAEQARGLLHGERDRIANAANLSALIYHALPELNWAGFYFFDGTELVVPLVHQGALVGVFDLDSPVRARFTVEDQEGLETIARLFVESLG